MHPSEPGSSNSGRLRVSVVAPVLAAFVGLSVMAVLISHSLHASSRKEIGADAPALGMEGGGIRSNVRVTGQHPAAVGWAESPAESSVQFAGAVASPNAALEAPAATKRYFPVEHISELDDLINGSRPEPEKLGVALATLESSDKKIRSAALEAVRGLDDRDAVPRLQDLAERTEDADEKAALLDAADFLNLPSFTSDAVGQAASAPVERTTAAQRLARVGIVPRHRDATPTGKP